MKAYLRVALVAAFAVQASACATITRGTSQDWVIDTAPQGARVTTSNGHQCAATPCQLRMPRESTFVATVTLEGYETETVSVTHQLANAGGAGFAGNVIFGGVVGMAIDSNNGATQDLAPNPVFLTLRPVQASAGGAGGTSNVFDNIERFVSELFN